MNQKVKYQERRVGQKGKRRPNLSLGGGARGNDDEADDEQPERRRGVRKTIQKPVSPSTIGIQKLREEFVNANNKNIHKQRRIQ